MARRGFFGSRIWVCPCIWALSTIACLLTKHSISFGTSPPACYAFANIPLFTFFLNWKPLFALVRRTHEAQDNIGAAIDAARVMHKMHLFSGETSVEDEDVRSYQAATKLLGWDPRRGQLKLRAPGDRQPTYLGTFICEDDARAAARLFLKTVLDKTSNKEDITRIILECRRMGSQMGKARPFIYFIYRRESICNSCHLS